VPDLTTSGRLQALLLLAATALLLACTLFASNGSRDSRVFWIGSAALAVAGVAAATRFLRVIPMAAPRAAGVAFAGLLAGFVAWSGLSIVWSVESDRSWDYVNRDLAYLAFAVVGLFVGSLGGRVRSTVAGGLACLLGAVVLWALAGKVAPGLGPDVTRNARLRDPVGYWNALSVLADMALVLGVWAATRAGRAPLRAGGAVLAYLAAVALALTLSRGGVAIGALALAAWLVLGGPLLETLAALIASLLPAGAVIAWATTRSPLVDAGQSHAARVHDGRILGVLLALGAAVVFGLASLALAAERRRPLAPSRRRLLGRAILAGAACLAVAALGASVARGGGPAHWFHARVHEFANPASSPVVETPGRFAAGSSNNRWTWWREAWHTFESRPWKGSGAGSFEIAHIAHRRTYAPTAREPHDLPLQVLSETGIVGFALLVGALAAAALAALGTLRRAGGAERAAAAALAACALAYGVHLLVDIGWDYAALSGPAFFVIGLLAGGGGRAAPRRSVLGALAALALAAASIVSLATPWLAARRVDAADNAFIAGNYAHAADDARRARGLNPLSLDAVWTSALIDETRGRKRSALDFYAKAVELQPLNADTWFALGSYEVTVLHDCLYGYRYLNRSYTIDPFGPAAERPSPLDKARAAVNRGRRRC
jgi:O-Antigen ligase